MRWFASIVLLICLGRTLVAAPVLAEAGEPVRQADGTVDIPATIDVLRREHVNTYLYQVWRTAGDWSQLAAFADAARDTGIQVWVYLVPWSETPDKEKSFAYPEPFKTDYIAWADAIGTMSRDHPAITGWVMDDFYVNATQPDRFTDEYVDRMLAAGKARNPQLKFYPIVYFQQPWADFVKRFANKIDGVIACYPRSMHEIDDALDYLNDNSYGPSLLVSFSRHKKLKAGTEAIAQCDFHAPAGARLRLYFDDQTFGSETGEHSAFIRINGKNVWMRRVGNDREDASVDLPLPPSQHVNIELGIAVAEMETGALVQARLDDIRIVDKDGKRLDVRWHESADLGTNAELAPGSDGGREFHVPMLVLVATLPMEHQKRYGQPPTVDNIAKMVRFGVDCIRWGKTAGVVCWYTPKDDPAMVKMVGENLSAAAKP